jgi:hypothetical protein
MSMETLNTAARAAGFAMAPSDDSSQDGKIETKPEAETWRSEAILLPQGAQKAAPKASAADWFKSLFGLSGRRAPA